MFTKKKKKLHVKLFNDLFLFIDGYLQKESLVWYKIQKQPYSVIITDGYRVFLIYGACWN